MSSFGNLFRVTTYGESHCAGVGCVVEGVPPRMPLVAADIQPQLTRRRPGQSSLTTPRNEADRVTVVSGTEHGVTLGTPVCLAVRNKDHRPADYKSGGLADAPRPSHADYTYQAKYGVRASSGGGRASARETIGRVAAGAVAEKWLRAAYGTEVVAWVSGVGHVEAPRELESREGMTRADVDASGPVRCPDPDSCAAMRAEIEAARDEHDSVGGVVTVVARGVPPGLGEPCFDKLEAMLAHAMLSIPATKGFEIGSGFGGARMRGSAHNDSFAQPAGGGRLRTETNRSGGIQGGISNGEPVVVRVAFKPPATIGRAQQSVDFAGKPITVAAKGRHDPCVVPRAVPIVEAMVCLVLADAALMQAARTAASAHLPTLGRAIETAADRPQEPPREPAGAAAAPAKRPASSSSSSSSDGAAEPEAKRVRGSE